MHKICSVDGCNNKIHCKDLCNTHYSYLLRHGVLEPLPRLTPEQRFWSKVEKTEGCWIWTGDVSTNGYGRFYPTRSKSVPAHVYSYKLHGNNVPKGYQVDHYICYNPRCVNPSHLEAKKPGHNNQNREGNQKNNTSGYRGVSFNKKYRKWGATAYVDGKRYDLGYFDTAEEADATVSKWRAANMPHALQDKRRWGMV